MSSGSNSHALFGRIKSSTIHTHLKVAIIMIYSLQWFAGNSGIYVHLITKPPLVSWLVNPSLLVNCSTSAVSSLVNPFTCLSSNQVIPLWLRLCSSHDVTATPSCTHWPLYSSRLPAPEGFPTLWVFALRWPVRLPILGFPADVLRGGYPDRINSFKVNLDACTYWGLRFRQ